MQPIDIAPSAIIIIALLVSISRPMTTTIQVLALVASVAAVTTRQPVVAVLYLVLLFSAVSLLIVIIGQGFIGLAYLIVYVGAIAMLFVFVVMLLNVKSVESASTEAIQLRSQMYTAVIAIAISAALASIALNAAQDYMYAVNETSIQGTD